MLAAGFDRESDDAVAAVRGAVTRGRPGLRMARGRPHLTLSAARVADVADVVAVGEALAPRHRPFPLVLAEAGSFTRVLWLGPRPNADLDRLHRAAWSALVDAGWPPAFGEHSAPGRWVPHCTLARGPAHGIPLAEPVPVYIADLVTIVVGRGVVASVPLGG